MARPEWLSADLLERVACDGVWGFDRDGVIAWADERMAALLGATVDELLGRRMSDFLDPPDRAKLDQRLRDLGGGSARLTVRLRRRDRCSLWVELSLAGAAEGGVASVRDLGADRAVQTRLENAELLLAQATAHMPGVAYQLRVTRDWQLCFDYVSEGVARYLGRSAIEIMRERISVYDLIHAEDVSFVAQRVVAAVRDLEPMSLTCRVLVSDGSVRHMYTSASVERLDSGETVAVGVALDITDSQRAEEERRASDARLHALFDNLPFDCWALDRDGVLVLQNGASLAEWGDQRGRALARAEVPAEILRDWQSDAARALSGETVRREGGYVIDGQARHVDRIVVPIHVGPRILGALCVNIDLTAQRRLEDQLMQSQKLDAISRMAGGVAHDFNNLLTAILSCVRLLERKIGDDGRRELAIIRDGGERAAALTKQLITFARQETVAPSIVELGELVSKLEGLLRRLLGEDVELSIACEPGVRVRVDPVRFEQILANLAANARDSMPAGGTVHIEVEAVVVDGSRPAVDSVIPPGRYALLKVIDDGEGMSEETAERAFEPFFTTRARSGGTGLGLSTVYGAVRQAGGHIALASHTGPSSGTSISIYLPEAEVEAAGQRPAHDGSGGETILVVEDEPLVRSVLVDALEHGGYRVLEAADYASAMRVSSEYPGDLHLLISDVLMPDRSGLELAAALSESRPRMEVLFMSGYDRDRVLPRASGRSAAFLPKPFTPERLVDKVREVLGAVRD